MSSGLLERRLSAARDRPRLRLVWPFAVVLLSGALGVLAFPPVGLWPLAAVSVAGFSVAVRGRSARAGAVLGYVYGWVFFGLLLRWTGTFVGPVWLLLPLVEAAFFALLGAALPALQRRRFAALWIAAAWTGQEALRDRLPFGGFPWGRWAFSQAESPLRWFAAVGGAPLVTAAVGLAGGALATVLGARLAAAPKPIRPMRGIRAVVAGNVAVLLAVPLTGAVLSVALQPRINGHRMTVALIQGDVPDRGLEFNARRRQVLDNHVTQTLALAAAVRAGRTPAPDLVVWPENASDIDPLLNPDAGAQIERAVAAAGVPILVGAILDGPGPTHISNVGILWSPLTGPGSLYAKRHPVPFGEYLPLRSIATAISAKAALIPRDMAAGGGDGLVTGGPAPLGDVICFEVAYDGLVRSSVRAGAQLIVVQTNNATFGHSGETYQQLAMSRLRAVEHGRTVVQVATSGKSAIIAPNGQLMAESGALFTPAILVRSVPLQTSFTLATRVGFWPELVLGLLAGLGVVATAGGALARNVLGRRPSAGEAHTQTEHQTDPRTEPQTDPQTEEMIRA